MLADSADRADGQGTSQSYEPEITRAEKPLEVSNWAAFFDRKYCSIACWKIRETSNRRRAIRQQLQVFRSRFCYPLRNRKEHDYDQCSTDLQGMSPTEGLNERLNGERRNCAAQS